MNILEEICIDIHKSYTTRALIPKTEMASLGATVELIQYLELPKETSEESKKGKDRIQSFRGTIIARHKAKNALDSTLTVRKMFQGGGVERVFLLNSPWVKTINVLSQAQVKRAKLYYLRERTGKSARLQRKI